MTRMLLTARPGSPERATQRRTPQAGRRRAAPATFAPAQAPIAARAGGGVSPACHAHQLMPPTLPIRAPVHRLEQEAGRAADQAMRLRAATFHGPTPSAIPGSVASPDHGPLLRQERSAGAGHRTAAEVGPRIPGNRTPGRRLSETTRIEMESYFGADFSAVKIHTDAHAAQVSRALGAQALTIGDDIFFARAKYAPGTAEGARLLAHELSHVVQQQRGEVSPQMIQRALADVRQPPAPPVPEPPVDCAVEITPNRTCWRLIDEMSLLRFEMADNERYLKEYEDAGIPDMETYTARLRNKAELQRRFNEKERIRAACCPNLEVPPVAPTAPPGPQTPSAPAPTATPDVP